MEEFDIIIIGAGTAGMTAGIYTARANKKVLLLEGKNYGGQINGKVTCNRYGRDTFKRQKTYCRSTEESN